jgi:hypothetical protein
MIDILELKKKEEKNLMDIPGVVGVGIGRGSAERIRVYVEKLIPEIEAKIPKAIDGVATEIMEIGKIKILPLQELATPFQERADKWRPCPGGVSIGHYSITAGTFGSVVYDRATGRPLILSNNHVLSNSDSVQETKAQKGDAILQPGSYDNGMVENDTIATLERWIKLDSYRVNKVDCAVAKPLNDSDVSDEILEIGVVNGIGTAVETMAVKKSGRSTALTTGTVIDVNATVSVSYGDFSVPFEDQIITTGMAGPGDSGSLLVSEDNKAVGLLFAGSSQVVVHNKIQNVIDNLSISFAGEEPPVQAAIPWLLILSLGLTTVYYLLRGTKP